MGSTEKTNDKRLRIAGAFALESIKMHLEGLTSTSTRRDPSEFGVNYTFFQDGYNNALKNKGDLSTMATIAIETFNNAANNEEQFGPHTRNFIQAKKDVLDALIIDRKPLQQVLQELKTGI